jgi:hypothetical protein
MDEVLLEMKDSKLWALIADTQYRSLESRLHPRRSHTDA